MFAIRNFLSLAILLFTYSTQAANLPFYPQSVDTLQPGEAPKNGYTRLKMSVSLDEHSPDDHVHIGYVSVCSNTACYRSSTQNYINLYDTHEGKSEPLSEMALPYTEIRSIHFESVSGPKSIAGDIVLDSPLSLEAGFQGSEILIILKKTPDTKDHIYRPIATASNLLRPDGLSVYYNPRFGTVSLLKLEGRFSIFPGATKAPQIFNIAVHDTGGRFPLFDIYPIVKLLRPASITATEIPRDSASRSAGSGSQQENHNAPNSGRTSSIGLGSVKTSKILFETGIIKVGDKDSSTTESVVPQLAAISSSPSTCASILSDPANKSIVSAALVSTGTVNLDVCENIAPYIHIVVTNLLEKRESFQLDTNRYNNSDRLALTRITSFSTGSQVEINGFTWEGDSGAFYGGLGFANGFVQMGSIVLGNNHLGGGFAGGTSDSNKLAFLAQPLAAPLWKEGSNPPLWTGVSGNSFVIVSSSTSIIKNGICATDSLTNRWSAVGSSPDARMIFISSTSGGTTSAAGLCPIFASLGVNNAIRLDGGPSAAMTIDGFHKNPLVGLDSFKYGSARYIAYALKVGYGSGSPPPTPAPLHRTVVPPNPCATNPRACL